MVLYGVVRIKQGYGSADVNSPKAKDFDPRTTNGRRVASAFIDGLIIASLAGVGLFFLAKGQCALGGGLLGGGVAILGFDVITKMIRDAKDVNYYFLAHKKTPQENKLGEIFHKIDTNYTDLIHEQKNQISLLKEKKL